MMKKLLIPAFVVIISLITINLALADNPPWVQVAFPDYNIADVAYDAGVSEL